MATKTISRCLSPLCANIGASRRSLSLLLFALPLVAAADATVATDAAQQQSEFSTGVSRSVEVKDSVKIYFNGGKSVYNPDLFNNRAVLSEYVARIKSLNNEGLLNNIVIEGYVSPDGPVRINERLAVERARVLADIIEQQAGVDPSMIKTEAIGIDWDELRRLIASRPDVPSRKALLDIIDNTPLWVFDKQGKIVGGRKKSLMDLRGGRPYRWLYANIFPEMRNATAISLSFNSLSPTAFEAETDSTLTDDGSEVENCSLPADENVVPTPVDNFNVQSEGAMSDMRSSAVEFMPATEPLHQFAIKTNMLYDAILLPNLEVEWCVNDKWSVTLEGNVAWWGSYAKDKSYRLVVISPEVRRWFKRGSLRKGFFAGATAGYGYYDLLKDTPGYRGEGVMAGVTGGYQWPISRNLSLEAELGLGYVYSNVKEYKPIDRHHVYMRTKKINYFGPIKLEFSLVWRFLDKNKSNHKNSGK